MIPADHRLSKSHASIRLDARLEATSWSTVDDLAQRLHQPRAAVVCYMTSL
jgi:hypothetical protein